MAAERVLLSDSKVTDVTLNKTSVRCSAFGYGLAELKINIPVLDGWTLFDHSNVRAGDLIDEPCMTAGACRRGPGKNGFSIEDILGSTDAVRVERIKVKRLIVEVKNLSKDENGNEVCLRHIEERLQADVPRANGQGEGQDVVHFAHLRSGLDETFPVRVCQ